MSNPSSSDRNQPAALVARACAGDQAAQTEIESRCSRGKANGINPWLAAIDEVVKNAVSQQAAADGRIAPIAARVAFESRTAEGELASVCDAAKRECTTAFAAVPLLSRPGWDEAAWSAYNAAEQQKVVTLPDALCLGRIQAGEGSAGPSSPFMVPFIGRRSTLVFPGSGTSRQAVLDAMQSLVMRIAASLPNQVQFLFIDPHNSGNAFRWANRLPGRIENTEVYNDLDAAERSFVRTSRNSLGGQVTSFEQIPVNQRRREKIQIVVVADFPRGFTTDTRSLELLRRIANNGMEGGTYVLLHWDTEAEAPRGFEMDDSGIKAFQHAWYPFSKAEEYKEYGWRLILDPAPSAKLQTELLTKLGKAEAIRSELAFSELVGLPPENWWQESAAERVVTPIGTRGSANDQLRILLGETADGQPCVHGVIGAGTGMGKSNLFHVFILGLAQRYAPDQLKFYLVDGKDGVEFRSYRNLPHAEVLSLNTAPQLARSLLADLAQEMERRNGLFSKNKVSGFKDYAILRRTKTTLPALPRLVLVVDEYQELFDGDKDGEASKYLALLAAQGRSAGLHMLLASQRFGASGMLRRDEIFSQIALRIAMKIAQAEVATLTEFQRAGKEAINALDGPGKVVINDRSGQDGFNISGIISLLKGPDRERLVQELATRAMKDIPGSRMPLVFEGLAQPRLLDNPRLAALAALPTAPTPADLERFAKRPVIEGGAGHAEWYAAEQPRIAWVGQEFNVRGHAALVVKRKPADNVVFVGNNPNARHGLLLSVLTSIALNLDGRHTQFALIDRTPRGSPWEKVAPTWNEHLARVVGADCRVATESAAAEELLRNLEAELDARKALNDLACSERPSIVLALLDPDRLDGLARKLDAYGVGADSPNGARLRRLFTEGPAVGIHVLLSVGTGRALGALIDLRKGLVHFRYRLMLQVSDDESFDLTGKRTAASLQADGEIPISALLCDAENGSAVRFKPHVAVPLESGDDTNPGVLGELPALAGILARRNSPAA